MNMDKSVIAARQLPVRVLGSARSWKAALVNTVNRLVAWINSVRAIRSGIAELRAMDDRLLADIGLTREQVEYLSRYGRLPKGRGNAVC
jgi:uncharacterized protein YjiS (DUF1127 family)